MARIIRNLLGAFVWVELAATGAMLLPDSSHALNVDNPTELLGFLSFAG